MADLDRQSRSHEETFADGEVRFKLGDQWYYRGNRSPSWLFVASRPDGSCQGGISERVPVVLWPILEAVAARLASSETATKISGIGIIKALQSQRDEAADALRRLMAKLREEDGTDGSDPYAPFAYDASWEALAREADATLAKCPSYSKQIQNICDGLGITREQLEAAVRSHSERGQSK